MLDWSSFNRIDAPNIHSVENLPHVVFTTSGRAAIYQALLQLKLPADSFVLVPTYHCPTMVAPVLLAQLNVAYFGVQSDGLPNLDSIPSSTAQRAKAMLVPHYFGLAKSLKKVREWCDARGIFLIEDCAHCYFGQAGERPVGTWGDYATASLSKFFPVPEAGLLASAHRPITPVLLERPSVKAQIKGSVDVIELATRYQRLVGIRTLLASLFKLKNIRSHPISASSNAPPIGEAEMMRECDMARINKEALWAAMALKAVLPRGRIIALRQQNFASYAAHFSNVPGARPLFSNSSNATSSTAPYVFPLWVEKPDPLYQTLRSLELPVFRWDRIWPDTPVLPSDCGPQWSHHVLQLLCHQDLSPEDVDRTARTILSLLKTQGTSNDPVDSP